jgi:hypothetical protein
MLTIALLRRLGRDAMSMPIRVGDGVTEAGGGGAAVATWPRRDVDAVSC